MGETGSRRLSGWTAPALNASPRASGGPEVNIDMSRVVLATQMAGEDAEDTELLKGMLEDAQTYIDRLIEQGPDALRPEELPESGDDERAPLEGFGVRYWMDRT